MSGILSHKIVAIVLIVVAILFCAAEELCQSMGVMLSPALLEAMDKKVNLALGFIFLLFGMNILLEEQPE